MARDPASIHASSLIGRTVGAYTVTGVLGHGGMASVFRARQHSLDREVALKILPPERGREAAQVERFLREARTAARLDHPNIIPVYDVRVAGDLPYIAMRLIDGPTLLEVIPQVGLPLARIDAIVAQIASALDYVHSQGLIHRDVTAGNVMLEPHDRVTLTDFGIAATRGRDGRLDAPIEGTAEYLAPELARGMTPSARSDIYALGVLTYEMVAGRLPFVGPDAESVLRQQVSAAPPSIRTIRPDLPAGVDRVLLTALAKDPAQRFPSAGSFAAAFHAALVGQSVTGQPLGYHDERTQAVPRVIVPPPALPPRVQPSSPRPVPHPSATRARRRGIPFRFLALGLVVFLLLGGLAMTGAAQLLGGVRNTGGSGSATTAPPATTTAVVASGMRPVQAPTSTPPVVTRTVVVAPPTQAVDASSPTAAVQGYYDALLRKDFPMAYSYWSKSRRQRVPYQEGLVAPESTVSTFSFSFPPPAVQGATATVVVRRTDQLVAGGTRPSLVEWRLVNEDGGWRLDQGQQQTAQQQKKEKRDD